MTIRRSLLALAAPVALLALSGCATPFRADVSRFQMMPAPEGQTFAIQAADPQMQGGLEFSHYAGQVAARLAQQGYRPADAGAKATLIVNLDYGVDNGHEKVVTTPGFGGYGGGWGYGGFGGFGGYGGFGGGFGRGGYGRGFGRYSYGWADPFWYQPFGYPEVNSYTYYVSHLDMKINRAADGKTLFEGRARARSITDSLPTVVPNLIDAMFTGFPGRSGEDVLITVAPPPKAGTAPR
ncbi:DUF4136 domain-containing protein [Sphingomonas sp. BIUV-7]|uniref:DUF4136 domain-containing protein n=1 Tax=Sphingomonas natans TaxID=3063330 RepID=A0ABT8Y3W3_9SPHN|nr:DUF4136 domain-containing protein [Sphingomonas sp. BIUV-7]MDO6413001.1 DUF4136 domain-containing protein [Sphingomonas sp. BIUV-7]